MIHIRKYDKNYFKVILDVESFDGEFLNRAELEYLLARHQEIVDEIKSVLEQ